MPAQRTTRKEPISQEGEPIVTGEPNTTPDSGADQQWVGLSALAAHHGRAFADVLEHYRTYARGAHLGLRRSEAAELVRRWREEDGARTAAEQRAAARAAEERDRRQGLEHGRRLLQALDNARNDQFMTQEQIDKESGEERLAMLDRRLTAELDEVAQALAAWSSWRQDNPSLAVAVEELARVGAVAPEPKEFSIPRPDWVAEGAESRRLEELEKAREREVLKSTLRAELAAERGA